MDRRQLKKINKPPKRRRKGNIIIFILLGVAVGFGLRYLGGVGQIIFWLIILFQAGCAGLVIAVIISAYREDKKKSAPFKMPYGGLTEYAVMLTYFVSGLIGSYWLSLPWSMRDAMIVGLILVLVTGATIVYIKGQERYPRP